jgi:hypothetical protein
VVLGVPGRLRTRNISTFGTTRVVGRQANAPAAFTPGEIPGTHFQTLSRPQGTWFCRKELRKKSQMTPPGIDPGTGRLAQRLNHYATPEKANLRSRIQGVLFSAPYSGTCFTTGALSPDGLHFVQWPILFSALQFFLSVQKYVISSRAPSNSEGHRSLQNCGSSACNLLHITCLAPRICRPLCFRHQYERRQKRI